MEFASKFLILITGIFLLNSCSGDSNSSDNYVLESGLTLNIFNANHTINYLNTINTDHIKLYYKNNGVLTLFTNDGTDFPDAYHVFQEPPINEKMIKIFCYTGGNNDTEETYVKWNDTDYDTISYTINRSLNTISITNIKLNSQPITNNNESGIFYVIKE